jgi:hypothetical protein
LEQSQGGKPSGVSKEGDDVGVALLILLLALLLGGVGLFVEALRWLLIIALVLLLISVFTGWRGRTSV